MPDPSVIPTAQEAADKAFRNINGVCDVTGCIGPSKAVAIGLPGDPPNGNGFDALELCRACKMALVRGTTLQIGRNGKTIRFVAPTGGGFVIEKSMLGQSGLRNFA